MKRLMLGRGLARSLQLQSVGSVLTIFIQKLVRCTIADIVI